MSAFSRGFTSFLQHQSLRLPSSIRIAIFSARTHTAHSRVGSRFFQSALRHYAKPASYRPAARSPVNVQSFVTSDPVLRAVQQTQKPVLLFRAPTNYWRYVRAYAAGALWVGTGLYSIKFGNDLGGRGLQPFVIPTYYVVGVGCIIVGCFVFTGPVRRCISLEVIPSSSRLPVQLRVRGRTLPFFGKEEVVVTNIGDAGLTAKLAPIVREWQEFERARTQDIRAGLEDMSVVNRFWELLARFIQQRWDTFFFRFKASISRTSQSYITIPGHGNWRIDCRGDLLEDGEAIDRLIAVD
ncbi:hypothetical protein P154DRAFT_519796 [Amniculicola lignicola CBS 123094]|uniref:Uncharacterized protein n=1 Tax=Amniculicola lignicola CBS 123094 TaxID=1392246 RepID=A0A6A5WS76_9PLEO|nr:hypothetical protein P154DRAFT_519796 [Amniculicola lignicola CBS 123094]